MSPRTHLFIKPLAPVYERADPYALPLLRVVTGLWLLPHGLPKLFGGISGTAEMLAGAGYVPGLFWAWAIALTEVVGGSLLAVGLFTRLAAAAIVIFLLTAVAHHWSNGFLWGQGGWEYPALWAVAAFVFLMHGGGRLSVDRAIGREF